MADLEAQISELKTMMVDLHRKVDAMTTRAECNLRHHDGGYYGGCYATCDTHAPGTPGCTLNPATTVTQGGRSSPNA